MAQIDIAHFTDISPSDSRDFTLAAREVVAREIHGLKPSEIQPGSVSVLVVPVDQAASVSGADTEVQLLVSGNNWPKDERGQQATAAEAKAHFDAVAARVYEALANHSRRNVYVWVTPFTASGWAEGE